MEFSMKPIASVIVAIAIFHAPLVAQEPKPVPKDSIRVSIPGCSKGQIFTAGPRTADEPGSADIPEGLHMRMNGQKQLIAEIKAHEGSMIVITGLMKKGQYRPDGVGIGGGIRISPGPTSGGMTPGAVGSQAFIDVEGWRPIAGACRTK
jgi:hypothetical protein